MRIALLVEASMLPIPTNINVLENWDYVSVVDGIGIPMAQGDHMYLEGQASDFMAWLGEYDAVWRTVPGTSPMLQRFEVCHIREELTQKIDR